MNEIYYLFPIPYSFVSLSSILIMGGMNTLSHDCFAHLKVSQSNNPYRKQLS